MREEFLRGAVDIHLHAGPSIMDREVDAHHAAQQAEEFGMRAIVLKDHYTPTTTLAMIADSLVPNTRVFGGIALNRAIGGFNRHAVEVALACGARLIWMPTVSNGQHMAAHSSAHGLKFPKTRVPLSPEQPLPIINAHGELVEEARAIFDLVASQNSVAISCGHASIAEVDAYVSYANVIGFRKLVVTHPGYITGATPNDIQRWSKQGTYVEYNACVSLEESLFYTVPMADIAEMIEASGPEQSVLSSDLGQKGNGDFRQALLTFASRLSKLGISEDALYTMTHDNPMRLIGLDD